MSAMTIIQMADRVAALLEERMKVRGRSLSVKVRKAGRRLPRKVREAATYLGEAGDMARNPKLLARVDEGEVARTFDICVRYLGQLKPGASTRSAVLSAAASVGFSMLMVILLVLGVIYWRGLI